MPYRCPCGAEFDPWEQVCRRCGGALDIEIVRAPVRMTCERGHVAFRETSAHHPCPVCNALLREAPLAQTGPDPPPGAESGAGSRESAELRREILEAEVRLRIMAYAMVVRALVVVGLAWPRVLGSVVSLERLDLPHRLVSGQREDIALCNAGFLLGILLLWEARQFVLRRSPTRWLLVAAFGILVLHDVFALLGFAGRRWDLALPFPWNIPGADRHFMRDWWWLIKVGIATVLAADLAVLRALLTAPYGLVFVYGRAEGRLATARQLGDATNEAPPWILWGPLVFALVGSAMLLLLVLW